MKSNNIIYADLSTYTPLKTMEFYQTVFGWKYLEYDGYFTAFSGSRVASGLYETPEKFKEMKMPHFWMTYIQVNDVDATAATAWDLGGIIELKQEIPGFGKIALIRDPLGSGFTVYEGENLENSRMGEKGNMLVWNELHVSDAPKIKPFYEAIFDWSFVKRTSDHYEVFTSNNEYVTDVLEIPNEFKGKYEYWVCTFGVENLEETKTSILKNGGQIVSDSGDKTLFTDNSGEAFFYVKELR